MTTFRTPKELYEKYSSGFIGAIFDINDLDKLLGDLKHPLFEICAHNLFGSGEGKISLPFKSVLKFDKNFGATESQVVGDCTSHGTRNAVDITRSCEIIRGEQESFEVRSATEAIYGARGFAGEGMSVSQAVRYVTNLGGILLRKKYPFGDFTKYNGKLGASWGRNGTPKEVTEEAKKHQVKTGSLITTIEGARDAIANGYALTVGSNVGFESKRDKNGISEEKGSWGHCMCWGGCDDSREVYDETLFLIINSWGNWNSGPKRLDQPEGSFWIRERTARKMLGQNQAFALSNVDGFPLRDISWTMDKIFS